MNDSALTRAQRAIELASRQSSDTLDLHGLGLRVLPPLTAELRTLRRLDLSGNRLRTVPAEVWQLMHLEDLDLGDNRIAVLDAEIGNLRTLRSLDLSENRLFELPPELAACTSLERLSLFDNLFSTLPAVVPGLGELRWLDLAGNRLETLPDLCNLARLQDLDLAGNLLLTLPPGLAALKELRVLDLSHNCLTSVDALALPASMEELLLDDNLLTEIPDRLRAITRLRASGNPIASSEYVVDRAGTASRVGPLRELVTGGYEDGKRYFEAPERRFGFTLDLRGSQAVAGSLNLYFKAFAGTPVSMRLHDGSRVDLTRVGRKAALDIAAPSGSVLLEFPPTSEADTVKVICEFAERTLERVPDSVLVEMPMAKRGQASAIQEGAESARPETPSSLPAGVPAATRDSSSPESSAPGAEPVDTAVFCPPQVARDSVFLVQVFLYPPRAATEVDTQARQADEAAERRGTYSLPLDLPLGTRVDLHLEMPVLTVAESDAVLVWRGKPTAAQFEVGVPADATQAQAIGRLRIAAAGVPAGTLRFQVALTAAGTSPGSADARELRARRYRRAFVSYSSQDRAEVLRRVQAFRIAGLSVFQDILDLDPGERFERELYHEIDRCDVFLLFWSRAAAASEWVGKEIDYALNRKQGDEDRPPDIQPVPIEGPPIVPPPANLKSLHFNDALLAQIRAAETPALPQRNTGDAKP